MSWKHTTAKRRRAQKEASRLAHKTVRQAKFDQSRKTLAAFSDHLRELAKKDVPIWPLARATLPALDPEERDLVAQFVAPHLVRMTPPTVRLGNALAEESNDYRVQS